MSFVPDPSINENSQSISFPRADLNRPEKQFLSLMNSNSQPFFCHFGYRLAIRWILECILFGYLFLKWKWSSCIVEEDDVREISIFVDHMANISIIAVRKKKSIVGVITVALEKSVYLH